jgi:hypothetical protein
MRKLSSDNIIEVEDDVETLDDFETSFNDDTESQNFESISVDKSKIYRD